MNEIKPIETRYKGFLFRSRLEARYAVFFDAMNIRWEYEQEGYELTSGRYLPDFYLPDLQSFVEIKGQLPIERDTARCRELCLLTKKDVLILVGLPDSFDPAYAEIVSWSYHTFWQFYELSTNDLAGWQLDPDEYGGVASVQEALKNGGVAMKGTGDSALLHQWLNGKNAYSPRLYAFALEQMKGCRFEDERKTAQLY